MNEPTIHSRDGRHWINRCPRCKAETRWVADLGGDWWECDNGHLCDSPNPEEIRDDDARLQAKEEGT